LHPPPAPFGWGSFFAARDQVVKNFGGARQSHFIALVLVVALTASCKPKVIATEPLFANTGDWSRAASNNADAQKYFDQGMRLLFGFNHDEAIASFAQALLFDDKCEWCRIGTALANGPHINNPHLDDKHLAAARAALSSARIDSTHGPVLRGLYDALAVRYGADDPDHSRSTANHGYATAMKTLSDAQPNDADVAALAAEAMTDLRPWDQWTHDGTMEPGTADAIALVDRALALVPSHPLANHLAIHIWEASPTPEKADASATRLRTLAPALAHLVHMPTHVDVRQGRWADAIASSEAALAADATYLDDLKRRGKKLGFYGFYVAHNEHMLAYAAMMSGRRAKALGAIRRMVDDIPVEWLRENASVADGITALPLEVMMRFGEWDAILASPDFDETLPISRALRRAARAVAFAALGKLDDARRERDAFLESRSAVPADARFGNNRAHDVLEVAGSLVDGEVDVADKHVEAGVVELKRAAAIETTLVYDEPPDWMQPAAHPLGAVLLNAGDASEAEGVYRADLARVPENGWALLGLAQSLEAEHHVDEAKSVRARFDKIWNGADTSISTSCLCQQHKP
jgi:tetratricopeptide (TPR) repeat protein